MGTYIGIDPGAKGAICTLTPKTNYIQFFDLSNSPKDIFNWLFALDPDFIKRIIIEDVHSIYGMSASSNFKFGWNVSIPHTILECLGYIPEKVTPKVWQKAIGVTAKGKEIKKDVASWCGIYYPGCDIYGPQGGLKDGRSDSLMIAHYAYLTDTKRK